MLRIPARLAVSALALAAFSCGGQQQDAPAAGQSAGQPGDGAPQVQETPAATGPEAATTEPKQAPEPEPDARSWPAPYANLSGDAAYLNGVSILARDPATGDLGFACLSTAPAIGALAVDARAGVGVVALGAIPDTTWKAQALDRLGEGASPDQVLAELTRDRQGTRTKLCAILDGQGRSAAFLGEGVLLRKSSVAGEDHVVTVCQAQTFEIDRKVSEAYVAAAGLPLPERLWVALQPATEPRLFAGTLRAGAILVVREHGGPDGRTDRLVDIRVDYDDDVHEGLGVLLGNAYRAWVAPRLRDMQKRTSDTSSSVYLANKEWLARIQHGREIGVVR